MTYIRRHFTIYSRGSVRRKRLYPEYKANRHNPSRISRMDYFTSPEDEKAAKTYQIKKFVEFIRKDLCRVYFVKSIYFNNNSCSQASIFDSHSMDSHSCKENCNRDNRSCRGNCIDSLVRVQVRVQAHYILDLMR